VKAQARKSIFSESPAEEHTQDPWDWDRSEQRGQPEPPKPILEQLRLAELKKRNRIWEAKAENRPMVFRRIPPDLRDSVRDTADELGVRADDVARAFLEYGLLCCQRGQLKIQPVLSEGRRTLFPTDRAHLRQTSAGWREVDGKAQPRTAPKKKKSRNANSNLPIWKCQASYRGIPAGVQDALRQIHRTAHVPLGEVAALLLGYALEAYLQGLLVMTAVPRQGAKLIFQEEDRPKST